MNKSLFRFCLGVLCAALLLSICLLSGLFRLRSDLSDTEQALALSRNTWETTAAAKETLQEELSEVTDALREANLTLAESEARAEELRQEIALLQTEIDSLTSQLTQHGIDPHLTTEADP